MDCELVGQSVYKCEWRVAKYREIAEKCKPKQKLTSPISEELPLDGVSVRCRAMLFPKGTGKDEDERPTVVVQFSSSGDSQVKLSFSCLLRSVSGENEIIDDAVEASNAVCGVDGSFGSPVMCPFEISSETAVVIISITFRSFSEERELLDNVRSGMFSFQSAVVSFMASPKGHASTAAEGPSGNEGDVGAHATVSAEDSRYVAALGTAPTDGFWAGGRWSVLLHVCVAFSFPQLTTEKDQALAILPPSDEVKQKLFEVCPPMRARSAEAGHTADAALAYWNGLLTIMERYPMINSLEVLRARLQEEDEADELLHVLLFAVNPQSISYFAPHEVEACVSNLREAGEAVLESPEAESLALLRDAVDNTSHLISTALAKQHLLRERIRALLGYHTWSVDAEKCLSENLACGSVNPLDKSLRAAQRLIDTLQRQH